MKLEFLNDEDRMMRTMATWMSKNTLDLSIGRNRKIVGILVSYEKPIIEKPNDLSEAIEKLMIEKNEEIHIQNVINSFEYEFEDAPRCVYGCLYKSPEKFKETKKGYWTLTSKPNAKQVEEDDFLIELLAPGG